MSQAANRRNLKKSTMKTINYVNNQRNIIDLRKNWVQFNEHGFEAINMLVLKSKKTEDYTSHALF